MGIPAVLVPACVIHIWFYWFPLVYTGLRTLQLRWIAYGLLYGLPVLIQMFFNMADPGVAGFFRKWEIAALVIAAIHSLRARGEYLVRLANNAERHDLPMEGARLLKQEVEQSTGIRIEEIEEQVPADAPETATEPAAPKPVRRLFDVNLIGERELAMLPGMGPARAKEATAMRQSLGGFHSFDHFAEKMAWRPRRASGCARCSCNPPRRRSRMPSTRGARWQAHPGD